MIDRRAFLKWFGFSPVAVVVPAEVKSDVPKLVFDGRYWVAECDYDPNAEWLKDTKR